jgi:hypothetical protein
VREAVGEHDAGLPTSHRVRVAQGKGSRALRGSGAHRLPWIGAICGLASHKERWSGARGAGDADAVGGAGQGCHAVPRYVGNLADLASRKGRGASARAAMNGSRERGTGEADAVGGAGQGCHAVPRFVGNLADLASRKERGAGRAGSQGWKPALLGEWGKRGTQERDLWARKGRTVHQKNVYAYTTDLSSSRD